MAKLRRIAAEPAGATYAALIRFAEAEASTFSLAWRRQLPFDSARYGVVKALRASMIRQHETDEWPCTKLVGQTAIVRFYEISRSARGVLEAADRLYAWIAPGRPEDLAFYTPAGQCWLCSIAHEREAFIDADVVDAARVVSAVRGLQLAD